MIGNPALSELARLKLRGYLRAMRQRMSRPSGIVFALIGLGMIGLWTGSIMFHGRVLGTVQTSLETRTVAVRIGLFVLVVMAVLSSLGHRGLYLPKDEVERLFAAPIKRADLIRYRLVINLFRSFFFALVMGVVAATRLPNPRFAFPATVVAVSAIPIISQASSLLFGDAENRLGRLAARLPLSALRVIAGIVVGVIFMLFFFGQSFEFSLIDEVDETTSIFQHPLVVGLTLPLAPWANSIVAETWRDFLPWFAFSITSLVVAFELTARIPVDFRLMSLETSADVARRLSRLRSGRSLIGGSRVTKRTIGWTVPWLFGRGPFGAIAWLKLIAIVRKSRGTLIFSTLVIGGATAFATFGSGFDDSLGGPLFIATLGVLYLTSFLRFDFRADFDLMEAFKTWPLAPWKIFLATLLPELLLITAMVSIGILVHAIAHDGLRLETALIVAGIPLVTLMWMALDNAVFLFAPVRFEPGQGSAMHHTGRAMVMLFLRFLLTGVFGGVVLVTGFGASFAATEWFNLDGQTMLWAVALAVLVAIAVVLTTLVLLGGWMLQRFDVARENANR